MNADIIWSRASGVGGISMAPWYVMRNFGIAVSVAGLGCEADGTVILKATGLRIWSLWQDCLLRRTLAMFVRPMTLSEDPERQMDLLTPPHADPLDETLAAISVRSSVYCLSELTAPWGFRVDGANVAKFHLVLEGHGWLELSGQEPVRVNAGDLVILPDGHSHVMRDAPGSAVLGLDSLIADHPLDAGARLRYGGAGPRTRLLCGGFKLEDPDVLATCLPSVLRLDTSDSGIGAWIEPVFALAQQEAAHAAPGAQAIFAKLADVFLTQALRTYLIEAEQAGPRAARQPADTLVRQAAELLTQQPGRPWTLPSLAHEVGMSRSLLAARFRAAIGQSPMRHLASIRLGQAAGYLTTSDLSLDAIAIRTGYGSNASLSKAFKREFGISPGTYRRLKGDAAVLKVR
jgi:AraC-like DNA-binding protein